MMKLNKIYNENCLNTMARMPDCFVDLTVTSPPYDNLRDYNGYSFDFENTAKEISRITKQGGVVVWIVGDTTRAFCESLSSFKQAIFFVEHCGFNLLDTMIWEKPNYAPGYPTLRRYDNVFDYMFVFSNGKPKTYNLICDKLKKESSKQRSKYSTSYIQRDGAWKVSKPTDNQKNFSRRTNVWNIANGQIRGIGHPAVFPEQLAHDHIISWSNQGNLVYDPFMGSGTTAKMAMLNNRNYIGSEISEEYCEIAEKRIKEVESISEKNL